MKNTEARHLPGPGSRESDVGLGNLESRRKPLCACRLGESCDGLCDTLDESGLVAGSSNHLEGRVLPERELCPTECLADLAGGHISSPHRRLHRFL